MIISLSFFFVSCRAYLGVSKIRLGSHQNLSDAEEFSRQGKFDEAIAAYKMHIEQRLKVEGRPTWENPYFYYLLIGDTELQRARVDEALVAYETAETNGVHGGLVSDRYRYVARWYEEKGQLREAIEILKKYRDRDSLLIDAMLDRLSRELVAQEESKP